MTEHDNFVRKKIGALRPPQLQIANERMGLVSAAE
jgi:hypothetical protein